MITKWQDLLKKISEDTGKPEGEIKSMIERYYMDVRDKLENVDLVRIYTPLGTFRIYGRVMGNKLIANRIKLGQLEEEFELNPSDKLRAAIESVRERVGMLEGVSDRLDIIKNQGISRLFLEKKEKDRLKKLAWKENSKNWNWKKPRNVNENGTGDGKDI